MGVFSEIKPKNSARKNPFDLSCYSTYNTKAGLILPLKFWPTLPNSEYSLDIKALMRTQPLATAAFAGFSINYDVVWTPYNDHYSSFNQFVAQRLNKQHTTQPDINQIPNFNLDYFVTNVIYLATFDAINCECDYNMRQRMHDNQDIQITIPAYLSVYFAEHSPNESIALGALRTLDLLEYGNYLPVVKAAVAAIRDFFGNTVRYAVATDRNFPLIVRLMAFLDGYYDLADNVYTIRHLNNVSFGFSLSDVLGHMADLFASHLPIDLSKILPDSVHYSLWPVLCYNKAFWQFYRNEYYDIDYVTFEGSDTGTSNKFTTPYVNMFNMDDISQSIVCPVGTWSDSFMRLLNMFAVKPHQYKKDLFTGLLPSTQYGSVSTVFTDNDFHKLIGNLSSEHVPSETTESRQVYSVNSTGSVHYNLLNQGAGASGSAPVSARSDKFKFDPALAISVLDLRRADSLQRFKERMLRAGNKTKDIFEAHGWESPYSEKAFDVQFLGSFDGRLDINVVASTTDTEQVNLGQLAGNGIGAITGNTVRFKSHDFGTLLIVAYITKDAIYDSYGVNKAHTMLESWDFPYPELQNVSLSPVTFNEVANYNVTNLHHYSVLGFLPQNMQYKTQQDKTHGEFYSVNPIPLYRNADAAPVVAGIFSNMVTPRKDILNANSLSFFYIQPDCADNIFVQNADGMQSSDQFFANVRFDLKAVQPLDVIGLPI